MPDPADPDLIVIDDKQQDNLNPSINIEVGTH